MEGELGTGCPAAARSGSVSGRPAAGTSVRRDRFTADVCLSVGLGASSHYIGLPQVLEATMTGMGGGAPSGELRGKASLKLRAERKGGTPVCRGSEEGRAASLVGGPGSRKGSGREELGLGSEEEVGASSEEEKVEPCCEGRCEGMGG